MIPDNPRIASILDEFVLDNHRFIVAEAERADRVFVFLGNVDHGPIVAKVDRPCQPAPKFEVAGLWRDNSSEWRVEFEHEVLSVCRAENRDRKDVWR